MENIVYYFLIVFGAILVWISCNDLRKLKENNAQWAEIERQSHLYNPDNYAEAEKLVKKLQKIIPFLAKFSLLNGIFAIVGSLFGLVGLLNIIHFNLYNIGNYSSVFLFMLLVFHIAASSGLYFSGVGIGIDFNKRYGIITEYINSKKYDISLQNTFDNFLFLGIDDDYNVTILFRKIISLSLNVCLFLLLISIFLDAKFRHDISFLGLQ